MILVERCHHQLITARPDRYWQVMQRIHCLHICSQQPFTDWPRFHRPNININLLVCGSPSKLFLCLVSEEKKKKKKKKSKTAREHWLSPHLFFFFSFFFFFFFSLPPFFFLQIKFYKIERWLYDWSRTIRWSNKGKKRNSIVIHLSHSFLANVFSFFFFFFFFLNWKRVGFLAV